MKKTILNPLLALAGCFAAFNGTSILQAQTTTWAFNYSGSIVQWTVPYTGSYDITAYGAQGGIYSGYASGGKGAHISGGFTLTEGEVLSILVGGTGQSGGGPNMGGGGGSFVVNSSTIPLVVAGGGAGNGNSTGKFSCINASTNTSGVDAYAYSYPNQQGSGGTDGNGGTIGSESKADGGGGGGGFYTDGGTHLVTALVDRGDINIAGGSSYINGGAGGSDGLSQGRPEGTTPATYGGFGGGGQGGRGGGGGGYSGGGGGYGNGEGPAINMGTPGGGGGSFLAASASNAVMTIGNTSPSSAV